MRQAAVIATMSVVFGLALQPIPSSRGHATDESVSSHAPQRFFLSGHSLSDDPFAAYLEVIAESQGAQLDWNQQIVIGSPLSWRTRGDTSKPGWIGYGYGKNRDGKEGLNVLEEFARQTEKPYDTLLVIEGHNAVTTLIWNDTVRHFRHFHERFIEQNSAGQSYFMEPWESIRDKNALMPWVENERNTSKAWGCVATRINASLAHEGRSDRIATIPTGAALAELVEAILKGEVPPLSAPTKEGAINALFADAVHLRPHGQYYLAAFTYMTMTGKPLVNAWYPSNRMEAKDAEMLRSFAWAFLEKWKKEARMDVPACRAYFVESFCDSWCAYARGEGETGRNEAGVCKHFFSRETLELDGQASPNPFVFDPAGDAAYWYPAK